MIYTKEQAILPTILKYAQKYGVPPALILAHIKQESAFNPSAFRNEPQIGDASMGLMQMLLKTAKNFDPEATFDKLSNPDYSINLGTQYIAQNLQKWPNIQDAIAAYNAGTPRKDEEGYYVNSKGVRNVQDYVNKVYRNYLEYMDWLQRGAYVVDANANLYLAVGAVLFGIGFIWYRRNYAK